MSTYVFLFLLKVFIEHTRWFIALFVEIYLSTWVITFWISRTFWIFPNWFAMMPIRLFRLDITRFDVDITFVIEPWSVGYQPMPILEWFLNFRTRLEFTWVACLVLSNSHVDTVLLFLYLLRFFVIIIDCSLVCTQISCLKVNTFLLNCLTLENTRSTEFLLFHYRLRHHSNSFFPSKLDFDDFFLLVLLVILNLFFLIM